ncbi:MAG: ORF6N domain-containing protein [Microscillaceae bacterium]|jgi:hypothetical protein|nr:ORF6N domain-containing protein [Microscillaceae bacterium]
MEENRVILREEFESLVIELRGVSVIIDRTLADFYGIETSDLNQNVKNNPELFPEDFVFQLTKDEKMEVTISNGHLDSIKYSRYLPYAYTRLGVYMIPTVLRTSKAKQIHLQIIRLFDALLIEKFQQKSLREEIDVLKVKFANLQRQFSESQLREEYDNVRFEAIFHKLKDLEENKVKPFNKIGFEFKANSEDK